MKRTLVFSLMLLLFFVGVKVNASEIPLTKDEPIPPGPVPRSVTYFSASASISETDLAVYFDWAVGNATITVYDENNNVIDQEVVNTNSTTEVYIDNTSWSSGDYTLTISYGTTNLIGYFQIP